MSKKQTLKFTFTLPPASRLFDTDPETVTITPLTLEQDLQGGKLVGASKNPMDKVKMAIAALDGKPVDWVNGGLDTQIDAMSPPARSLLISAFMRVHNPNEDSEKSFLESMTTQV
jgi:hypothetical protein